MPSTNHQNINNMERKQVNGVTILGNADSWQLFSKSGGMQRNVRVHIAKGVVIYAVGYACNTDKFVVYNDNMDAVRIFTGDNPEEVSEYEYGEDGGGFNGYFLKVDGCARPISEQFGIGTYYDESGEIISDEIIEKSLAHANAVAAKQAEWEKARDDEFKRKEDEVRKKYGAIIPEISESGHSADYNKRTKANIMALLKHTFPGVKFTARMTWSGRPWCGYTLSWTNGPSVYEVEQITELFELTCERDRYNDDIWEYENTAFTSVFGGVQDISCERKLSVEFLAKCQNEAEELAQGDGWRLADAINAEVGDYIIGHGSRRIEKKEYWGTLLSEYRSDYVKPDPKTTKAPKAKAEAVDAEVEIVDYSEKAIAVIGNTSAIKEVLKKLGGRFNPKLKCGAGWIFSKRKESELRAALAI